MEESLSKKIEEESKLPTKRKKKIIMIVVVSLILILAAVITILIISANSNDSDEREDYDPIPKNEDLSFNPEEHYNLSRRIASEGMVLATNKGNILPLKDTDKVVLFGQGTEDTVYGGWGSGEVYEKGTTNNIIPVKVLEGIEKKAREGKFEYTENTIGYEIGISNLTDSDVQEFAKKEGKQKRSVAILTITRRSGEGSDRPQDKSSSGTLLTDSEIETYNSLKTHFDNVVVILNVGSVMELNDMEKDEKVSILISFLPGMKAGDAIADVLVGDVNPSGHLTDTWAKTINDYSTTATFIESPLYIKYKEGLFVGYRYFEDNTETQSKVVFPFGYGLSYTTFTTSSTCKFDKEKGIFTVTSIVKNTGDRSGKEVVQIYVQKPQNNNFIKVMRELVGFAKTKVLQPGEEESLLITFKLSQLASYDDTGCIGQKSKYVLEEGEYNIYAGNNVADTRDISKSKIFSYKQEKLLVTEVLTTRLQPKDPEVADANKKPNFSEFMYKKNNNLRELYLNEAAETISCDNNKKEKDNSQFKDTTNINYKQIPVNKINEINFKTVLQKRYTMEQLIDTMSDEEMAYVSYGHSAVIRSGTGTIGGNYNAGITGKYLIPSGDTLDGPAGLRQSELSFGSTAWPSSTLLASTWDVNLAEKVGIETGKEARLLNCSFWLAPGMNIHRSPLNGRNFEYYSEDPLLTGKMAAAITKGLQSKRVSITLKHFAFNDKEENRNGDGSTEGLASDSRMAERVAREIYLKGFEIAVKEGKPWSIMSSYNRMNSMKTAESYDLLTGILREEWGYEGLVMTDWGTNSQHDREAHGGNDVKMPGNSDGVNTILSGLRSGIISRNELKRNCLNIFNTLAKTAAIDQLFIERKPINIVKGLRIQLAENIYHRAEGVSYENCAEGGINPTHTQEGAWFTIYINNENEGYHNIKFRYSAPLTGFGVAFKTINESLGEITNLEKTGDWQIWQTTEEAAIFLPKGTYELILLFLGYDYNDYDTNKGNIQWLEFVD